MPPFNPNNPGTPGKLFGLPYDREDADLVIIPVPWDVTVSYGAGTSNGPQAILDASIQIDYSIPNVTTPWTLKTCLDEFPQGIYDKSKELRPVAEKHIHEIENNISSGTSSYHSELVNEGSQKMNDWLCDRALNFLDQKKIVGCLGGDHSTPLGLIEALSTHYENFGVLQIDAHMDLRESYEDFRFSHASIMHNALQNSSVSKLVQVGIRDYCKAEADYMQNSNQRIITYFDQDIKEGIFKGTFWGEHVKRIIHDLPKLVYISFDIDGLDPSLCPNTGTPVPGGLSFDEATYLIREVAKSGRQIIGFDLSEVSPGENEWDANVASRILYQLGVYTGLSQGRLKLKNQNMNSIRG